MEYYGYMGKILYVDLTTGSIEEKALDLALARKFLGGMGMNLKMFWDLSKPSMNPLSPDAPLIIGVGPMNGTLMPGSGKCTLTYKRPILGSRTKKIFPVATAVGGNTRFGAMLKHAGYSHVVITGRAANPCYLYIGSDAVKILDASDLWGKKDVDETSEELIRRHKGKSGGCGVWTVGRAGEKLVKWAGATVDRRGSLGGFGGGAVMGSKNLKAVVTWGNKGIKVAQPKRFMELCDMKRDETLHVPGWGLDFPPYGGGSITPEFPKEVYDATRKCPIGCMCCLGPEFNLHVIPDGRWSGTALRTMFWAIRDFTHYVGIKEWRDMLYLWEVQNRTSLGHTTFKMIHFLCKLYEKGVISKKDTDGLELKLGDFECYLRMMDMIIERKGSIGEAAAEGWYALGERVGMEWLDDWKVGEAIVKGADTLLDARWSRLSPTTLGNVTFSKPQHTHAATHYPKDRRFFAGLSEEEAKPFLMTFDLIKWDFANRMVTTRADFERVFTEESLNIGRFAKHAEDCKQVYNSLALCDISPYGFKDPTRDLPFLAEAYSALTGMEMTPRELKKTGERISNLDKMTNVREGFGKDEFPAVWVKNTETPYHFRYGDQYLADWFWKRISKQELYQILDDYYDERGWDIEKGVPTKRKLRELEIEEFALEATPE